MTTIIMRTTARVVVPIILVIAIELLLQGHNLPGGGFISGVLTVVAFALIYVAYGLEYLEGGVLGREIEPYAGIVEHRTVVAYRRLFKLGIGLAIASGFGALLFGEPFLSQTFSYAELPLFGDVEIATALLFDVGVYCVVVGGLLTILSVVSDE